MMKRSPNGAVVHDVSAPLDQYVTVSKMPQSDTTKVVWHVDPALLVGPREEEVRRKAPEGKFLYGISAFLTIMVLWGIFRQVHYLVPQLFAGSRDAVAQTDVTGDAFQVDVTSADAGLGLGGRKEGRSLLEVHQGHFLGNEMKVHHFHGYGGRRGALHQLEGHAKQFLGEQARRFDSSHGNCGYQVKSLKSLTQIIEQAECFYKELLSSLHNAPTN